MTRDPCASARDYSKLKEWLRWLRPEHLKAHKEYWKRRADWIGRKNFENYFATADRTIDKDKWEYLRLRKSRYKIPLRWELFAGSDCTKILDLGCGDGDLTQTLADFIADYWQKMGQATLLRSSALISGPRASPTPTIGQRTRGSPWNFMWEL